MCLRNVRGVKGRARFLCIDEESVFDTLCIAPRMRAVSVLPFNFPEKGRSRHSEGAGEWYPAAR